MQNVLGLNFNDPTVFGWAKKSPKIDSSRSWRDSPICAFHFGTKYRLYLHYDEVGGRRHFYFYIRILLNPYQDRITGSGWRRFKSTRVVVRIPTANEFVSPKELHSTVVVVVSVILVRTGCNRFYFDQESLFSATSSNIYYCFWSVGRVSAVEALFCCSSPVVRKKRLKEKVSWITRGWIGSKWISGFNLKEEIKMARKVAAETNCLWTCTCNIFHSVLSSVLLLSDSRDPIHLRLGQSQEKRQTQRNSLTVVRCD